MAKTIVFKPEFEKKLKELKIKTKFVKNCKSPKWNDSSMTDSYKKSFENAKNWWKFLQFAFQWEYSVEGYSFWKRISCL
jgi:hypothetical protein